MIPVPSPCGLVVDYLRSCARGFWRFYPSSPDVLTPGFHYFAPEDTPTLPAFHPFGSSVWTKDGMTYPYLHQGQVQSAGTQWYNGEAPEQLPPDAFIFPPQDFDNDYSIPDEPVRSINGFDRRCFSPFHPGVDIDVDRFLRPDVTDCCWQRFLAQMLWLLTNPYPQALADFTTAANMLWGPDCTITVLPVATSVNRFAWIDRPEVQIIFRVGTQEWSEIFEQCFHGLQAPNNFGSLSTSPVWFDEAQTLEVNLAALGWNPDKPVSFVGHSKGGATLWILARRMIEAAASRSIDVLTMGIPKVGDSRCANQEGLRNVRHVIHRRDPIPLVPPTNHLAPLLNWFLSLAQLEEIGQWQNFPSYQFTGDGWGNAMGPAEALPWQTYAEWMLMIQRGQVPDPFQQHYLSSYAAALADCCDGLVFPFSDALWDFLFGAGGAWGGAMIGALDATEKFGTSGGGVEVGGGSPPASSAGGIAVAGDGDVGPGSLGGGVAVAGDGDVGPGSLGGGVAVDGDGDVGPGSLGGGVTVDGDGLVELVAAGGVAMGGEGKLT